MGLLKRMLLIKYTTISWQNVHVKAKTEIETLISSKAENVLCNIAFHKIPSTQI